VKCFRYKCGLILGFCNPPPPKQIVLYLAAQVLSTITSGPTAKAGNVLTQAQFPVCYNIQPNCGPRAQVCLVGLVVVRARARVVSIAVRVARIYRFL
jgi:hypothetical protein